MAEAQSNGQIKEQRTKRQVTRGAFPRVSLVKVLELPRTIFAEGEGESVRRLTVFNRLGKSPESGPSRMMVTTANTGYGLTTGGTQAEYLGLTDRGRKMVDSRDEFQRMGAAYEALFSNEILSAFISRFKGRAVPNDEVAVDYLKNTPSLSMDDAQAFWEVIRENIHEFGLVQELSGRRVVVSKEMAMEQLKASLPPEEKGEIGLPVQGSNESDPAASPEVSSSAAFSPRSVPQIHFNIQVHLPESASPETYESIFRSIAIHLLNRAGG